VGVVEVRIVAEPERRIPRLEFRRALKKQTTLPSLAYAGIPYHVFAERDGALLGDIAVIAQFARSGDIGAATEHEDQPARPAEAPVARIWVVELATKYISVPRPRPIEIVYRQHGMRSRDAHARILTQGRPEWVRRGA
jgi:hypothetical protein